MKLIKITLLLTLIITLPSCLKETESTFDKFADNRTKGELFLTNIASQQDVIATESGLLYEVIEAGSDDINTNNFYTFEFKIRNIDNEIISDSGEGTPINATLENLMLGVSEGLQLMTMGSTYKFYIPYHLAYGSGSREFSNYTLDPYSAVVFEIKLVEFPGLTTTDSGLQYEVITQGTGDNALSTDNVTLHYHGTFLNGNVFDSSVERDAPISGNAGGFIAGFTEGLTLMNPGSKYKLYIPYDLAYGASGSGNIPPYALIVFEVELISIN